MRTLFLDVDGVLNSEEFFKRRFKEDDDDCRQDIDDVLLKRICATIKEAGCRVVISSAWRTGEPHKSTITNALKEFGVDVFGYTQYNLGIVPRGEEIRIWNEEHFKNENYVILDDNSDFLEDQMDRFVQTDHKIGLTESDCQKILEIFKKRDNDG